MCAIGCDSQTCLVEKFERPGLQFGDRRLERDDVSADARRVAVQSSAVARAQPKARDEAGRGTRFA